MNPFDLLRHVLYIYFIIDAFNVGFSPFSWVWGIKPPTESWKKFETKEEKKTLFTSILTTFGLSNCVRMLYFMLRVITQKWVIFFVLGAVLASAENFSLCPLPFWHHPPQGPTLTENLYVPPPHQKFREKTWAWCECVNAVSLLFVD